MALAGQAQNFNVGDGWAIASINGIEILEMPFVKALNMLKMALVPFSTHDFCSERIRLVTNYHSKYEIIFFLEDLCFTTVNLGKQ